MAISFRTTRNLGLILLLTITISVCIFSYHLLRSTTDELSVIVTRQNPKIQKWHELSELISDSKDRLYDFQSGKTDVIASVMIAIDKAYKVANEINGLTTDEEESININDFLKRIRTFRQATFSYAAEVEEGYKGGASAHEMESMVVKTAARIAQVSRAAVKDIEGIVREENLNIIKKAEMFRKILGVVMTLAIILTGVIAFVMSRAVGRPIRKLAKAAIKVAKGDLSVRVDIDTKDEIGQLASVFNRMAFDLAKSKQKLEAWAGSLEKEVAVRTRDLSEAKAKVERYVDTQITINAILRLSLNNTIFDNFLNQALNRILAIPRFFVRSQGAIFLIDDGRLLMRVQCGLPDQMLEKWKTVSLTKSIFAQAISTQQVQFIDCVERGYQDCDESLGPHKHYHAPIIYAKELLGVMDLLLGKDYDKNQSEIESLKQITDTVAGVIVLKQGEDALQVAYQKVKETQVQSEKMGVVGRLAIGIAHEVKNPLAIILTGIQYLPRVLDNKQKALQILEEITTAVHRADSVVRGLLDFSRASKLELTTENLNSLLYNSLALLDKKIKEGKIELVAHYTEHAFCVDIDVVKMDQVFLNLFMNAIHAMPEGGKLTVRTYQKRLVGYSQDVGRRVSDTFKTGELTAVVEIEDSGCGIPDEAVNRIFEPFFTTRRSKGGTGLGLSMVKNIIDMHGGAIYIENKKDTPGVKVTIVLRLSGDVKL